MRWLSHHPLDVVGFFGLQSLVVLVAGVVMVLRAERPSDDEERTDQHRMTGLMCCGAGLLGLAASLLAWAIVVSTR